MENKGSGGTKTNNNQDPDDDSHEENPSLNLNEEGAAAAAAVMGSNPTDRVHPGAVAAAAHVAARTPFTNLSQVDADLALARTLQEQERAYMMLRFATEESDDFPSWGAGSYLHDADDFDGGHEDTDDNDEGDDDGEDNDEEENEYDGSYVDDDEDAFEVHAVDPTAHNPIQDLDPEDFSSDESYARALQDAEEQDMAARLMALTGIHDHDSEDSEEHGDNSMENWEEIDPDELSYEELLALGEVVGTESRGLSADTIASLPSVKYKTGSSQNGTNDSCVICRLDYEEDETLTVLSCKHSYHSECINNWLKINKVCPVCSAEVSTSGNS